MSLPKEPRQKMINIMYLVLTALLALNVSSEILNAFKTVNNSLITTNATIDKSTGTIMKSLESKLTDPTTAEKAKIWYPRAQKAQAYAQEVYAYIQGLKDEILRKAGGDPNNSDQHYKEDNLDIATRMMVEGKDGKTLLQKLTDFKKNILGINDTISAEFAATLPIDLDKPKTQNKSNKTWEAIYFHMVPTVAAMTILSKFQNDVKTSENKVVTFCHSKVGEVIVHYDTYAAIVGQNSSYLMPGQELEIKAGVGAFSKAARPSITINGQTQQINDSGFVRYHNPVGNSLGQGSVPVHIEYIDQDGNKKVIETKVNYAVGQSAASIALDKMNVLYIGVDNPVSISATAGGAEKLQVSMQGGGGSITTSGGGHFIARVNNVTDDCKILVSVDGKAAGSSVFRVRTIPDAQAYVGGQPSGANINAAAFKAQGGVGAGIKNFPFELSYDVVSFTFTCDTDDDIVTVPSNGAAFNGAVRQAVDKNVQAGRTVTIDNIRVKGPDGRTTTAPSLVYYIK